MKRERDISALWAALSEGEPEVDESQVITSSDVNLQTAARIAELSGAGAAVDRIKLRFSGPSTTAHRLGVRPAAKGLLAIQEALSSVGASIVDHIGKAGRWPAEVLSATDLQFTPQVLPGSVVFALVHTPPGEEETALFDLQEESLLEQALASLLSLFSSLEDDDLTQKVVTEQLAKFGPRASKHLFDLAQVLVNEGLSLDVEWQSSQGQVRAGGIGRRSAAYLKELAKANASSTVERDLIGQLITVSEVEKQGLLLDDGSRILLEADRRFQDVLAALYRQRVQVAVQETVTVSLSTGAETRSYVLTDLKALGSASPHRQTEGFSMWSFGSGKHVTQHLQEDISGATSGHVDPGIRRPGESDLDDDGWRI